MADAEINEKLEQLNIEEKEAEEEPTFDLSLKKKKKKKKAVAFADEDGEGEEEAAAAPEEAGEEEETEDIEAMFSGPKRKNKSKKSVAQEDEEKDATSENKAEQPEEEEEEDADIKTNDEDEESWLGTDRDYTYKELLNRVFKIQRQNNPDMIGEKKRFTIVPPQVAREGSKKTAFANIADICRRLNRSLEHFIQFLFIELGTTGSIDGSQRLIIKGRFQQKQMETIIRRYIVEYVTCKLCKSPDTTLTKDNRLTFMQCESCGATKSVSAVKSGFQANLVKRAKRKPA